MSPLAATQYLEPANVAAYGRFGAIASPWVQLGANCLPTAPGGKNPAVAGWGKNPGPALHSVDSPKIGMDTYIAYARDFRDFNVAVFPATIGAMVIDIDRPELLDAVIEAVGDSAYRTYSGREGGRHPSLVRRSGAQPQRHHARRRHQVDRRVRPRAGVDPPRHRGGVPALPRTGAGASNGAAGAPRPENRLARESEAPRLLRHEPDPA